VKELIKGDNGYSILEEETAHKKVLRCIWLVGRIAKGQRVQWGAVEGQL
jgi:hypothetical protein